MKARNTDLAGISSPTPFDPDLVDRAVFDKASPGSVNWKHALKPPIKMPFRKLENCNQVLNIGKELNFAVVNVAENDIVQGNKKLILGLEVIWSSVVKIGQSLYLEAPRMDPFRPDQKTPIAGAPPTPIIMALLGKLP
ncbi:hypothetical protein Syun_024995 [Stephania yunnanensis]|uniref:Calponin-homology (CH) domain-containing protein n=1 Tax=Stephania yunnanensis TaxID=152371 RepID=A0AAP0HVU1_9MAGN